MRTFHIGPHKQKVSYDSDKQIYVKQRLSETAVRNYKLAEDLQIGIKCQIKQGTVITKQQPTICQAIRQGYLTKREAIQSLKNLRLELHQNRIAHCDFKSTDQIVTIDNGDMKFYGQPREVHTPNCNTTARHHRRYIGCNRFTDLKGFRGVIRKIRKM